jgi:ribosomal-protein-alanine N-acetyltransferase
MTQILTDRLVLKKPGPDDKPLLVSQIGDWEVSRWLSRVPYPYTLSDADEWLDIISSHEMDFNVFKDGLLIGGAGLTQDEDDYHELGYWLGRKYWGHGFATEACRALLDHARLAFNCSKIKASYLQGNAGSANVLKKLGFEAIGEGEIYCVPRKETVACIKLELA